MCKVTIDPDKDDRPEDPSKSFSSLRLGMVITPADDEPKIEANRSELCMV